MNQEPTTQEKVWTRKDYMMHRCTHSQFYGQFVNEHILNGIERLRKEIEDSQDENLNDIPLKIWDSMTWIKEYIDRDKWRKALGWDNPKTYPWSMSDQVCIAKEAARMLNGDGGKIQ